VFLKIVQKRRIARRYLFHGKFSFPMLAYCAIECSIDKTGCVSEMLSISVIDRQLRLANIALAVKEVAD
jgi:hypothetical protein